MIVLVVLLLAGAASGAMDAAPVPAYSATSASWASR